MEADKPTSEKQLENVMDSVAGSSMLPTLPDNCSGYKVECKIGEGSFSDVLKCRDKESGKLVAAKLLKKTFRSTQHVAEVPELIAMRKLTAHANILHLLESHFDPLTGKVVLVFDLMDSSLYDNMKSRRTPFPEARSKNYLYQMIKGVEHIHSHGIFHRDIKPENILVKGNLLKISDLGSIKGIYNQHPYTEYIGTRWYRSPECLLTTGYYGPKVDVWAIGCVFYELLTLKPLFPGSSEIDQLSKINSILGTPSYRLMAKIQKHKSRNISNFAPKQGTGLNALIPFMSEIGRDVLKQMLVYDPDLRINIRRLKDHKYFEDYKDLEAFQRGMAITSLSTSSVNTASRNNIWKNPALLSYLTNDRRRKKATIKLKKEKTIAKKENESGLRAKATASGIVQRLPPPNQQSSAQLLRGAKRIGDAQSTSSIPVMDGAMKTISNPVIALRMRKQENQLMASKSLRNGIGNTNKGLMNPSRR